VSQKFDDTQHETDNPENAGSDNNKETALFFPPIQYSSPPNRYLSVCLTDTT